MNRSKKLSRTWLWIVLGVAGVLVVAFAILSVFNTPHEHTPDMHMKSNMSNIQTQAELYHDVNSSYSQVCESDPTIQEALKSLRRDVTAYLKNDSRGPLLLEVVCNDSKNAWALSAPLVQSGYYCVDSQGTFKQTSRGLHPKEYVCI